MAAQPNAAMAVTATNLPDRGIVVGIGNYTQFDSGRANDLHGPVADAQAVADWLVDSAKAHVTLITSEGRRGPGAEQETWQVTDMRPIADDLQRQFNRMAREAVQNGLDGQPSRLGRRLYVYMAGHGFMPEQNQLAIVTADSINPDFVQSLQATAWIDWFSDQYHFDELVLWMDCCAGRDYYQPSLKPLMRKEAARSDQAKMFVAFAAKPTRDAFEAPLPPDQQVRGIFTSRLLAGLKGAAADQEGKVTTESLIGYLNGSGLVGEEVVSTLHGAVRPDHYFPRHDSLEFAQVAIQTPSYRLHVPLPDGTQVAILDGSKALVATETLEGGIVTVTLGSGLYKAEAPGFSDLFEIAAGTEIDVPLN